MVRQQTESIHRYILANVSAHPRDIASLTGKTFNISRQAVNRHLHALTESGAIEATGQTRSREYRLRTTGTMSKVLRITPVLEEDLAWREYLAPHLADAPQNVREICYYGFTEVINNVLSHAGAKRLSLAMTRTANGVSFSVTDDGDGVFASVAVALGTIDDAHAALELTKGGVTSAPGSHKGGTLFFAMKMFDRFAIHAGALQLSHAGDSGECTLSTAAFAIKGTSVSMEISFSSARTMSDVFDAFASDEDTERQIRTMVPVALLIRDGDALMTRSQARRLTRRLEAFEEVLLDFRGVETIGRAFADEVFRTFREANPGVTLMSTHANADVRERIRTTLKGAAASATS